MGWGRGSWNNIYLEIWSLTLHIEQSPRALTPHSTQRSWWDWNHLRHESLFTGGCGRKETREEKALPRSFIPHTTTYDDPGYPNRYRAKEAQSHELCLVTSGTHQFCFFKSHLRLEKKGPRNSRLVLPLPRKRAGMSLYGVSTPVLEVGCFRRTTLFKYIYIVYRASITLIFPLALPKVTMPSWWCKICFQCSPFWHHTRDAEQTIQETWNWRRRVPQTGNTSKHFILLRSGCSAQGWIK